MPIRSESLGCFLAIIFFTISTNAGDWELVPQKAKHVRLTVDGDVLGLLTTGNDPNVTGNLSRLASKDRVLEFEFQSSAPVTSIQVYVGPPINGKTKCDLPGFGAAQKWKTYARELTGDALKQLSRNPKLMRIDFGKQPGVQVKIRNLKLRPLNDEDLKRKQGLAAKRKTKTDEADRITAYLTSKFPVSVDAVKVTTDRVLIDGSKLPSGVSVDALSLVEYPPWHSIGSEDAGLAVNTKIELEGDRWQARVPRKKAGRDRLHSGWRLQYSAKGKTQFVTSRAYATEIETVTNNYAAQPLRPANQKGMGGIMRNGPLDELTELGVTAITVNIPLTALVARVNNPSHQRIPAPGQPVFFNPRNFKLFDPMINWARENNIVVTAILLVPVPKQAVAKNALVHPDNDGGNYAMPDLKTERGAIIYSYVLDRVARRYSNHEKAPGGIANWIAHNEIDYHQVWTNMGQQPREIVTETYYRSMRMIHNAARQHNPHARVFTSTTHHWYDPNPTQWKTLAPAELYVALQRYSVAEGDFNWGVAHHPYPERLQFPIAWQDESVSNDIKTPKLTIQNIEVLDKFLNLNFMSDSRGKPRPVLLSEQGFSSDKGTPEDLANQAGSLAYAMRKIRAIPNIESFHYHRWADHKGEKLAKFGLRTLPTESEKFGKKKPSWEVYKAIGTAREDEVTRGLPGPR